MNLIFFTISKKQENEVKKYLLFLFFFSLFFLNKKWIRLDCLQQVNDKGFMRVGGPVKQPALQPLMLCRRCLTKEPQFMFIICGEEKSYTYYKRNLEWKNGIGKEVWNWMSFKSEQRSKFWFQIRIIPAFWVINILLFLILMIL